jgi:glycosyltransferase involved in cell wall biosynthesis
MQKIRALIFVDSLRLGGSERQAVELCKRLDRSSVEPLLACFQKEGPLAEELQGYFEDIHAFPLQGFFNAAAVRQAGRFLGLLKRSRVQVVQCFDFYSNMFAIPLARLARVPVILGSRRDQKVMRTRMEQKAEQWCLSLATGVVTNSAAIKNQIVREDGIRSERVWVIHNGLDLDRFDRQGEPSSPGERATRKNDEVRIAVVANLRPEKGHLVFVNAANLLARSCPQARFAIVGDGSMRGKIEARIRELGLNNRVQLTGAVENIPAFLKAGNADILVNPSESESFPNAVMEAMAASLPVVATDVGGTNELVAEGLTGYLVPRDEGTVMAERLARLCNDPDTRVKMGEAGRRRIVERFTADLMAKKFENLYQSLVNRN